MLKLVIVDDEYLIRQYIRNCIDWEELGFTITGEFGSAQSALNMARTDRPDLVLADICMPGIDGISFTEEIKTRYPEIKVIVITGHGEFTYAQKGLRAGLNDFLLKPIDAQELQETVLRVKKQIQEERAQDSLLKELSDYKAQNEKIIQEYYLKKVLEPDLSGSVSNPEIIREWFPGMKDYFCAAVLEYDDFSQQAVFGTKEVKGNCDWLKQYLLTHLEGKKVIWVLDKFDHMVLISFDESFNLDFFLEELEKSWKQRFLFSIAYGLGVPQYKVEDIYKSYLTANNNLNCAIAFGDNQYKNYSNYIPSGKRVKNLSLDEIKKMQQYIETNSMTQLQELIDSWFEAWRHTNLMDMSFIKLQILNAVFYFYLMNDEGGGNFQQDYNHHYQQIFGLTTLSALRDYFRQVCQKMKGAYEEKSTIRPSNLVFAVRQYMGEHMGDEMLSLTGVAKEFYMNSSYLSRIFKKETGMSFVEYLTSLRIEKAKTLLKDSDLKIYEIAEKIGISNSNYFGILFKKKVGCSPLEYRGEEQQ